MKLLFFFIMGTLTSSLNAMYYGKAHGERPPLIPKRNANNAALITPILKRRTTVVNAVLENNPEELQRLIDAGEDPLSCCAMGGPLLFLAITHGFQECVQILMRVESVRATLETLVGGQTPLHVAILYGYESLVSYLLIEGCNPNTLNSVSESPLYTALKNGHYSLVNLLRLHGAQLTGSQSKRIMLVAAIQRGQKIAVNEILAQGTDPNEKIHFHRYSYLELAFYQWKKSCQSERARRASIVCTLLKAGAHNSGGPDCFSRYVGCYEKYPVIANLLITYSEDNAMDLHNFLQDHQEVGILKKLMTVSYGQGLVQAGQYAYDLLKASGVNLTVCCERILTFAVVRGDAQIAKSMLELQEIETHPQRKKLLLKLLMCALFNENHILMIMLMDYGADMADGFLLLHNEVQKKSLTAVQKKDYRQDIEFLRRYSLMGRASNVAPQELYSELLPEQARSLIAAYLYHGRV